MAVSIEYRIIQNLIFANSECLATSDDPGEDTEYVVFIELRMFQSALLDIF